MKRDRVVFARTEAENQRKGNMLQTEGDGQIALHVLVWVQREKDWGFAAIPGGALNLLADSTPQWVQTYVQERQRCRVALLQVGGVGKGGVRSVWGLPNGCNNPALWEAVTLPMVEAAAEAARQLARDADSKAVSASGGIVVDNDDDGPIILHDDGRIGRIRSVANRMSVVSRKVIWDE